MAELRERGRYRGQVKKCTIAHTTKKIPDKEKTSFHFYSVSIFSSIGKLILVFLSAGERGPARPRRVRLLLLLPHAKLHGGIQVREEDRKGQHVLEVGRQVSAKERKRTFNISFNFLIDPFSIDTWGISSTTSPTGPGSTAGRRGTDTWGTTGKLTEQIKLFLKNHFKIRFGAPDGRGVFTTSNGDEYRGQFERGLPNGDGEFTYGIKCLR